jgi:hypothetical protein
LSSEQKLIIPLTLSLKTAWSLSENRACLIVPITLSLKNAWRKTEKVVARKEWRDGAKSQHILFIY